MNTQQKIQNAAELVIDQKISIKEAAQRFGISPIEVEKAYLEERMKTPMEIAEVE